MLAHSIVCENLAMTISEAAAGDLRAALPSLFDASSPVTARAPKRSDTTLLHIDLPADVAASSCQPAPGQPQQTLTGDSVRPPPILVDNAASMPEPGVAKSAVTMSRIAVSVGTTFEPSRLVVPCGEINRTRLPSVPASPYPTITTVAADAAAAAGAWTVATLVGTGTFNLRITGMPRGHLTWLRTHLLRSGL